MLTPEEAEKAYGLFLRHWEKYGLSRLCCKCRVLTPAMHCFFDEKGKLHCRYCKDRPESRPLQLPGPQPPALKSLNYVEQRLIAMASTSQYIVSLPSGGASGQWGRMYVVPLDEPRVCDVLDNVEITEGGQIYVSVAGAKLQSPASPCKLRAALLHLRDNHKLYKTADVSRAIQALQVALSQGAEAEAGAEPTGELQEEQLEFVTVRAPSAPPPKRPELQRCRDLAQLPQNMDTKIFPHLFPTGQGGWDERMPFPRYSRSRLLGAEPRFEQDPSYVHFLLDQYYKRKISANANVRIGKLQQPSASSRQALLRSVYTTMRDIPGTQPYLFAKRGVAASMYEQLGAPHWFMTLTCHARQEPILAACIYAKLLRDNAAQENGGRGKTAKEIRTEVASVLYNFMSHESYAWQGFSANQLCNSQPAVVARQFFHQVRQFLAWLAPAKKFDEDLCQEFPDQDEQDREE